VPAVLFAGCGDSGGGSKGPAAAKVSGTVTLDERPMQGGEVRFSIPGHPPKALEVKDGAFSGEVLSGPNTIEVVWEVEGSRPHPMDPTQKLKDNKIDAKFSGPNSPLKQDIPASGASDLKL
jgi:hypothetical protein